MQRLMLRHDVLDMQLCNLLGEKIGRVDAVVLESVSGQPLRVTAIVVGGSARRDRMGKWVRWLGHLLRGNGASPSEKVSTIPFSAVRRIGDTVDVDVNADLMASEHVERWLREHVVRRIPGADGDRK